MKKILAALTLAAMLPGCAQMMTYPPSGDIANATKLGPVHACKGGNCCYEVEGHNHCEWPLSLNAPPPEFDVQYALKQDAAKTYSVPVDRVVIDVINLSVTAEVVGTVRAWDATAVAYVKPAAE